ncbi:MAG: single-stranded DNA-binding protein [Bacteroidetes bacterium]|nr:single-stranded DNA-binding protein [Bacteroidota bacterium]
MVQLFGRITRNAKVTELKDGKKVTNFSIAINDEYKSKTGKVKKVTYVECAYWLNPDMSVYFTKGKLLEVNGRLEVSAYNNLQGEAVGKINFHVSNFKFHGNGTPSKKEENHIAAESSSAMADLPF